MAENITETQASCSEMSSVEVWGENSCRSLSHPRGDCKDMATGLDTTGDSQPELNLSSPSSKAQGRDVSHLSYKQTPSEGTTKLCPHCHFSLQLQESESGNERISVSEDNNHRNTESGNDRTSESEDNRITESENLGITEPQIC